MNTADPSKFIGLMSGTSLDGVDAVLACFNTDGSCQLQGHAHLPFPTVLRDELMALNSAGNNEIERSQIVANQLAVIYAACIARLLRETGNSPSSIVAVGCHGQTIRHRPDLGFTVQIGNAALLAELSGICVVSDFRSRDIAAGGQGAPLVPAFHQSAFGDAAVHRVIVNIGGISNLSDLPLSGRIRGFDCGPGNLLMDGWTQRHLGTAYDQDGAWAASGKPIPELLQVLLNHPFFSLPPPKSTGRDTFSMAWLDQHPIPNVDAADVQATLLELATRAISDAIIRHCPAASEVYLCGGGALNSTLRNRLQQQLGEIRIGLTDSLGIPAQSVEAAAFAWLARQTLGQKPGNIPAVTGASGPRILGAVYPA
jgi:anhydro-N-acetylmuramic acid kinase